MKCLTILLTLSFLLFIAGCAGPMGPPLGLGPAWDELAGVAIVGVVAALSYRPLLKLVSTRLATTHSASPLDILRERYARGEINQEEFERLKQHLS